MTLQQKMLAKQSKKGFTLVELVVVIAILAILAAIAIPAVIGMIQNANESQKSSDAATVDSNCKSYYAGLVAGSINDKTFTQTNTTDTLPAAGASSSDKKTKALACTVGGALDYNGTYAALNGKIGDFGYDTSSNIYSMTDAAHTGCTALTIGTTFSAMGYK